MADSWVGWDLADPSPHPVNDGPNETRTDPLAQRSGIERAVALKLVGRRTSSPLCRSRNGYRATASASFRREWSSLLAARHVGHRPPSHAGAPSVE